MKKFFVVVSIFLFALSFSSAQSSYKKFTDLFDELNLKEDMQELEQKTQEALKDLEQSAEDFKRDINASPEEQSDFAKLLNAILNAYEAEDSTELESLDLTKDFLEKEVTY